MVKRHPHTAIITIEAAGKKVNGEWVEGSTSTLNVIGRYDPASANTIRFNSKGDEVVVKGEFYTRVKPIAGAVSITVETMGVIDKPIICWDNFQTHCVINI